MRKPKKSMEELKTSQKLRSARRDALKLEAAQKQTSCSELTLAVAREQISHVCRSYGLPESPVLPKTSKTKSTKLQQVKEQLQHLKNERTSLYNLKQRHPSDFKPEHLQRIAEINAEMRSQLNAMESRQPTISPDALMEEALRISTNDELEVFLLKCKQYEAVPSSFDIDDGVRKLLSDTSPSAKARLSRLLELSDRLEQEAELYSYGNRTYNENGEDREE